MKRNKEERKNAIKNNTINIIWTDNPFIDISKQDSLFDSIKSGKENFIITITPKTECHCLIRSNGSISLNKNIDSTNKMNCQSFEQYLVLNYYININAYSSIRYFLSSIILICVLCIMYCT